MNFHLRKNSSPPRAQTLVEFALVLPLILLVIFGIIEFGRLLFVYIATTSASREAARYGSAVGRNASGLPRYLDCTGMRAAAKKAGVMTGITDNNILIHYDSGPGHIAFGGCLPSESQADDLVPLGYRVIISITAVYQPIVPIINPVNLTSVAARTIVKDVDVGNAIVPTSPPEVSVYFTSAFQNVDEPLDPGDTRHVAVTVQLNEVASQNVTVFYSVSGTASEGADFVIPPSPITIPGGSLSRTIDVVINGDDLSEDNETIIISIDSATGAVPSEPYRHTITIVDNDSAPVVHFENSGQMVSEAAGRAAVLVQLDKTAGQPVTVPFTVVDGSAKRGSDYELATLSPVVIQPGTLVQTIFITITNDLMDEDDEDLNIIMGTPVNADPVAPTQHHIVIQDNDDPPQVMFTALSQNVTEESHAVKVGVHLSAPSSRVIVVPITLGGSATQGSDYQMVTALPLTIPAGVTDPEIDLNVLPDGIPEPDETIILTMGTPQNATLATPFIHTVNIMSLTVAFTADSQAGNENIGRMYVTLRLSSLSSQNVTVPFTLSGTATNGVDYTITPPSQATIPAGSITTTLTIDVVPDTINEIDEAIVITMGDTVNAAKGTITTHTAWITNDDPPPSVAWSFAGQSKSETAGSATVIAQLSAASGQDISVPYSVSGTANPGSDFNVVTPSPLVIPAGQASITLTVSIIDDTIFEGNETVIFTMGNPVNATLGTPIDHILTIVDDDAPVCHIYAPYPLTIVNHKQGNPKWYRVSWLGIQNTDSQTLMLNTATITWPNTGHNAPFLNSVDWIAPFATRSPDWAGIVATSPYTVSAWNNSSSADRTMAAVPANVYLIDFDFDVELLEGDYTVSLVFRIVDLGLDCPPIQATTHFTP